MILYDDDPDSAFVNVEFEPKDVRSFADSWPCFHGPDRVRFTFERSSGDLVDMEPIEFGGREASVMAEDVWEYFREESEPEPDPLETFRAWLAETPGPEQLEELARHGADAGFSGLTYTADCVELFKRYQAEIRKFSSTVRINYLTADEIRTYMAALRPAFRPLFELLVGTGMRLGEAEGLRLCDLSFEDGEARASIEDAETPTGIRSVPLPLWVAESLEDHIEAIDREGTDPVITIPRRTVEKEHNRACEVAGIHDYPIHDHRHTTAVQLARSGMPLNLIQRKLGHTRIEQTKRYARFHPEYGDVGKYFEDVEERLGLREAETTPHSAPHSASEGREA